MPANDVDVSDVSYPRLSEEGPDLGLDDGVFGSKSFRDENGNAFHSVDRCFPKTSELDTSLEAWMR